MLLTHRQEEGLTKFIRMALSEGTNLGLSELIGVPLELEVMSVSLQPIRQLKTQFSLVMNSEVVTVQQAFTGSMAGDALLLFDYQVRS